VTAPTDWRGTPITEGALVIYGAGVGRSIQLVEGTVEGFTPKGAVKVRIVRRSYVSGTQAVVTVGPDRLTIVTSLPETSAPTQDECNAVSAERRRVYATHSFPDYWMSREQNIPRVCAACGVEPNSVEKECPQ
jgi:hypothetical protein